jgi:multisubunit Na+/H+ antiporter MnhE subunit
MNRRFLEVIAVGTILLTLIVLLLMWLKIVGSPSFEEFILGWLLSLTIWVFNIREDFKEFKSGVTVKLDLIWKKFKKRKRL